MLCIRSALHIIFYCILVDPRNSKQLKDPQRESGISLFSYLSFLKFWKEDHLVLIIFPFECFFCENKIEGIKWLLQNKEILEEKILKSNKNFIRSFIAILLELGKKIAFFKIALEAQINVHLVRYIFRGWGKFISGFLESV